MFSVRRRMQDGTQMKPKTSHHSLSSFRQSLTLTLLISALELSGAAQTTILTEGFEGAFPGSWSVGDANPTGTAAYWSDEDIRSFGSIPAAHGGNWAGYCAGVGHAGTALSPTYQNSMDAYMSRSVNLSGYNSATLSFWYIIPSIETGSFDKC